jgi:hypothetical protein
MMRTEPRHLPSTYAAVVFKGEALDPDLVSSMLETNPTLKYRKGDAYTINDVSQVRRVGLWVYSTRNQVISDSLKKNLEVIEELLIGAKSAWQNSRLSKIKNFVESEKVQLRVDIYWHGEQGSTLPKISKSFQQVVEMAGGAIEEDFHRNGDAIEFAA